jgi:hypothetical protein
LDYNEKKFPGKKFFVQKVKICLVILEISSSMALTMEKFSRRPNTYFGNGLKTSLAVHHSEPKHIGLLIRNGQDL